MSVDRKFNDSKKVLKTVIFILQVGFTGDSVFDYLFKPCLKSKFSSSDVDTAFLPECTSFCTVFRFIE